MRLKRYTHLIKRPHFTPYQEKYGQNGKAPEKPANRAEKNIVQLPRDIKRDCRKLSSSIGPNIKAIRNGAAGICNFSIENPKRPITNITVTSNIVLFTAYAPKTQSTRTTGNRILWGISAIRLINRMNVLPTKKEK